jgi:hypothetical protein
MGAPWLCSITCYEVLEYSRRYGLGILIIFTVLRNKKLSRDIFSLIGILLYLVKKIAGEFSMHYIFEPYHNWKNSNYS